MATNTDSQAGGMDSDAATSVAQIAVTADGGCVYCATALIEKLAARFPEHAQVFDAVLAERAAQLDDDPDALTL